ncbi:hypothetical protein MCGE09_00079 [Thaumarchaeota archaeon SCGC AB-539-E09]|nr:hypothetical protein MCGE09_00079 [Thaumarchaeota archaeon SCGC AB-539-E09]
MMFNRFLILIIILGQSVHFRSVDAPYPILTDLDDSELMTKVKQAETSMLDAYRGILEAEKTGADIEPLTSQLSIAGEKLTLIHLYLKSEDESDVESLADYCIEISGIVLNQANSLVIYNTEYKQQHLVFTILDWIIVTSILLLATYFTWRMFRDRYYDRFQKYKIKVN